MKLDKASFTMPNICNDEVKSMIHNHAIAMTYPAKTIFLEPGTILDGVYYIDSGRTRHYMVGEDGMEKILYTLSDGWFFGETPCSVNEPTGLFSKTEIKSTLYKIPLREYWNIMDQSKEFRDAILNSYSKKMLIMRNEIENLAFNSCKDRLKRLFCTTADTSNLIEGKWFKEKVHYTQYELSTIVGGARVTVNKLVNELCNEEFIRILNRHIQINADMYYNYINKNFN